MSPISHDVVSKIKEQLTNELTKAEAQTKKIRSLLQAFSTLNGETHSKSVHVYRNRVRIPRCHRCKKPFWAKRVDAKYCHKPCTANLLRDEKDPSHGYHKRKKHHLTKAERKAILAKNLINARAALAKLRQKQAKAREKYAKKGVPILPGDPLTAGSASATGSM